MICSSKNHHYFTSFVFYLVNLHFWMPFENNVRIDQKRFMPQKIRTLLGLSFKMKASFFLQKMGVISPNCIPELRSPLMDIIESGKVKIFFMPAKKSLPSSDITIGFVDSLDPRGQGVSQERIQAIKVPLASHLIHESASEISTIDGWGICDSFPELTIEKGTNFSFSSMEEESIAYK